MKLSVIIPVFNSEKNIRKAIESALNQSLKDIEILCVDEGSTDSSCDIIKEYAEKDSRVRMLCTEKQCEGAAYRCGISSATGEYIHFLKANDYCLPYGYEAVTIKAMNRNLDVLKFCAIPCSAETGRTLEDTVLTMDNIGEGDFLRLLDPHSDDVVFSLVKEPWSGIYRRRFLVDNQICLESDDEGRCFYAALIAACGRMMISADWVLVHSFSAEEKTEEDALKDMLQYADSLHQIEENLLEKNISEDLFSKIMEMEVGGMLEFGRELSKYIKFSEKTVAINHEAERVVDEYANKYSFLRKYRDSVKRLLKKDRENNVSARKKNGYKEKKYYYDECRNPKVSVVVPTYNQEEYLNAALRSLARQTLKDIEFICINDGSKDSTLTILKQFADIDKRFIIIDKQNTGYGNSMNIGIDAAKGKYLGILEPDDYVPATMFGDLYEIAEKENLEWIKSDFYRFRVKPNGELDAQRVTLSNDKSYYGRLICPLDEPEVFQFPMNTWSGIYSLDFLNKWGIRHNETPGASFQDNGFWFRTFCRAERGWFRDAAYYMNRRDNPNSSVFNRSKTYTMDNEYKDIFRWLQTDPELLIKAERVYYLKRFIHAISTYYRIVPEIKREFIHHVRDDFKEPLERGKITEELFTKGYWEMLNEIVDDPDAFCEKMRVSVIIPAYNAEKYIRECLDSLLVRNEITSEIIVVNDGSTDDTLNILREYEKRDSRITVINQPNAGAGAARNNGMKYAKGEYLLFLDADDFFDPTIIRRAYRRASSSNSDIVVFGSDQYDERTNTAKESRATIRRNLLPTKQPFTADQIKDDVFNAFIGWPWDKIFRREFVEKNGLKFQEQRTTNDLLFVYSAIIKAESICTLSRVLAHHRRLGAGESLSVSREKSWFCFYDALCALRAQLKDWNLYERYERDFINYSLHFSLWNLQTIRGDAYFKLYDKLRGEWFKDLGIEGKNVQYFYNRHDYDLYQKVMKNEASEYLFDMLDEQKLLLTEEKNANRDLKNYSKSVIGELRETRKALKHTTKELEAKGRELKKIKKSYDKVTNKINMRIKAVARFFKKD